MCGRFQLSMDIQEIIRHYSIEYPSIEDYRGGDFYPSSAAPIVYHGDDSKDLDLAKWGFKLGEKKSVINARAETIGEKPLFKVAFQSRRCIVPANLFYEWKEEIKGKKVKYRIGLQDQSLLSLGGIYNYSEDSKGQFNFVIVTTGAEGEMSSIHSRMPLILKEDAVDRWLDTNTSLSAVRDILHSNAGHKLYIEKSMDGPDKEGGSEQIRMF